MRAHWWSQGAVKATQVSSFMEVKSLRSSHVFTQTAPLASYHKHKYKMKFMFGAF